MDKRFDSHESMAPVVRCHEVNIVDLRNRVRLLEKMIDTRNTPLWKRALFRLDGWPRWTVVADKPAWRPWRRWWRS